MDPLSMAALASALGLGAVVSAAARFVLERQHRTAETDSITVDTATQVVGLVKDQLIALQVEVRELEAEVAYLRRAVDTLSAELHARGVRPSDLLEDLARRHRGVGE